MNKKLSRLFSTNLTVYFTVMVLFCLVSWFRQKFVLAVVESIVTVGLFIYYKIRSARRKKDIAQYLQDASISVDSVSNEEMSIPVPALILNMSDQEIMWCNDAFMQLAGASDSLFEVSLGEIFPDLSTDWLTEGKSECPEEAVRDAIGFTVTLSALRTIPADIWPPCSISSTSPSCSMSGTNMS